MKKRKFILGTDWWTDCDDAVALRLIARAHRRGEISLEGVCINACMEYSVASLDAFLINEGIENMKIALDREAVDFSGTPPYQERMAKSVPGSRTNRDALDPVTMYSEILRENDEIEIIEIGYPQVLARLAQTEPELIKSKVKHLWVMGGKWSEQGGRENNFCRSKRASQGAHTLCGLWPSDITFLGYETGESVITGGGLGSDDMLHLALLDHGHPQGRSSWDPMLVSAALYGTGAYAKAYGTASVNACDGANFFTSCPGGRHCILTKLRPDSYYEDEINEKL